MESGVAIVQNRVISGRQRGLQCLAAALGDGLDRLCKRSDPVIADLIHRQTELLALRQRPPAKGISEGRAADVADLVQLQFEPLALRQRPAGVLAFFCSLCGLLFIMIIA